VEFVMCIFPPYSAAHITLPVYYEPKEIIRPFTIERTHPTFHCLSLSNLVNYSLNSALNLDYVLNAGSDL